MLRLEMLPARHGDALWIEYGDPAGPHRILIDGGPRSRSIRESLAGRLAATDLELLVVTHIDADHISGVLAVLTDPAVPVSVRDVWFNGWEHLPTDLLGAKQGEALGAAIRRRRLPWNGDFDGRAVMAADDGRLPAVDLPGGMRLTVLSPTRRELAALRPVWKEEVENAGLVPGMAAEEAAAQPDLLGSHPIDPAELAAEPFEEDPSEANGASIAMLAEFEGKTLLLTGDAHGGVLAAGLRRLAAERGADRVPVDAFKVPHHGSKHNLSAEVLGLVECDRYLFSTNGDIYRHPDPVAVSRIVTGTEDATLEFNYRCETTDRWDSARLRRRHQYRTAFPNDGEGLAVEI
jgi:beta-lactamase superfamily II metal-dependent hydrolase